MPAVIKASSSVLAGNLALVSYDLTDSLELSASINATFVTVGSANVDAVFRPGSPPPQVLSGNAGYLALIASKNVLRQPTLASCTTTISNGLKTIEATYTTEVQSPGVIEGSENETTRDVTSEVSTATEQRSLSGSVPSGDSNLSYSIDYLVKTTTYDQSFSSTQNISDQSASFAATVGLGGIDGAVEILRTSPSFAAGFIQNSIISVVPIETIRTYRNNLGQARISVTRSAQLVQTTQ
jgi:hypothetical protein